MSELIDNTVLAVEQFNNEIKDDLSSKGIDDTREAANSIRVETSEQGTKISIASIGIDYLYYLDQGRGPGKFPPVDKIEAWVANKPVDINPFLVGRKIAREGTTIFRDHSKGIMLDEKRQALLADLKQKAPEWAKQDILVRLKTPKRI